MLVESAVGYPHTVIHFHFTRNAGIHQKIMFYTEQHEEYRECYRDECHAVTLHQVPGDE